jgi:protein-S-isoprenylcysteine O-methyltransferase Ste14
MVPSGPEGRGAVWVVVQTPLLVLALVLPFAQHLLSLPSPWPSHLLWPARVVGAAALLVGIAVYRAAKAVLGPHVIPFLRPAEGSVMRKDGIYARLRHPIYLAILIGIFGWALMWTSALDLLVAALTVPFFALKARHEEQFLIAAFPEYAGYKHSVPGFVLWHRRAYDTVARQDSGAAPCETRTMD